MPQMGGRTTDGVSLTPTGAPTDKVDDNAANGDAAARNERAYGIDAADDECNTDDERKIPEVAGSLSAIERIDAKC